MRKFVGSNTGGEQVEERVSRHRRRTYWNCIYLSLYTRVYIYSYKNERNAFLYFSLPLRGGKGYIFAAPDRRFCTRLVVGREECPEDLARWAHINRHFARLLPSDRHGWMPLKRNK